MRMRSRSPTRADRRSRLDRHFSAYHPDVRVTEPLTHSPDRQGRIPALIADAAFTDNQLLLATAQAA